MLITVCKSCGLPMERPDQHGGSDSLNPYCVYCTDEFGNLKTYDEVLQDMTRYMLTTMQLEYEYAQRMAEEELLKHPAWKYHSRCVT